MVISVSISCIMNISLSSFVFFFFNDTATTEIYTLSLHDALPICRFPDAWQFAGVRIAFISSAHRSNAHRSEEHTSELQSPCNLVCRLLLEKKKKIKHLLLLRINNLNNSYPRDFTYQTKICNIHDA